MRIGFIGLGKLGLPCALAAEQKGHEVFGVDPSPLTRQVIETRKLAYIEAGAQEALEQSKVRLVSMPTLVRDAELIFVAVQTPHSPQHEGITPVPVTDKADFDYTYLCNAIQDLCRELVAQDVERDVVVISTVLPGTVAKYIRPIIASYGLTGRLRLAYNPFFIAMGTAMADFLDPEFVLLGIDNHSTACLVRDFYATIHARQVRSMTVENAELTKVLYNTFIGTKIVIANTIMELCHKTPNTNCDVIADALTCATTRLISGKYLRGGMGDGGGCHPRDNIALSWLADKLQLSHDLFYDIMICRDDQTKWLATLICDLHGDLPVVLLGEAFKPGTNIVVGSPAKLLAYYLETIPLGYEQYDPYVNPKAKVPDYRPALFFVATQHEDWKTFVFPPGSIVLDPFRYLQDNRTIHASTYIPIGVNNAVCDHPPVASSA